MSYPDIRATVVRRDGQRHAGNDPQARTRFIATSAQTGNDFGLFEVTMAPGGGGPGAHFHTGFSETFYVLDGELAVLNDTEWTTAHAGDLIYVPRHGVHGFRSAGEDVGARFLILFTPGIPREQYFDGLLELHADGREPTTEEIDAFAAQHDQINLRDR
ncbi:MAG TPA: cupin domain-containing protein [Jatrophihabitantaceae bacterium]|nr:cupin domain-containing protein [Jatrophihabitantaceae bacterium]